MDTALFCNQCKRWLQQVVFLIEHTDTVTDVLHLTHDTLGYSNLYRYINNLPNFFGQVYTYNVRQIYPVTDHVCSCTVSIRSQACSRSRAGRSRASSLYRFGMSRP